MKNIFLQKSYTTLGRKTIVRLFSKKSKLSISLDQEFESFIRFVFVVCEVEGYLKILKFSRRPLDLTSYKAF